MEEIAKQLHVEIGTMVTATQTITARRMGFVRTVEAARMLGVSQYTIYRMIVGGMLTDYRAQFGSANAMVSLDELRKVPHVWAGCGEDDEVAE